VNCELFVVMLNNQHCNKCKPNINELQLKYLNEVFLKFPKSHLVHRTIVKYLLFWCNECFSVQTYHLVYSKPINWKSVPCRVDEFSKWGGRGRGGGGGHYLRIITSPFPLLSLACQVKQTFLPLKCNLNISFFFEHHLFFFKFFFSTSTTSN
jgi:hypothetical protein